MSDQWKVNLDVFEGPLDLLLHLINKFEIDIYDIPIKEITEQYLDYLRAMQLLQLDVAGDYLVMAATLMSIKSQLLLPRNDSWEEEGEEFDVAEDSIEHLRERLLEYRKIKYASEKLTQSRSSREHFYSKSQSDLTHYQEFVPLAQGELELKHLLDAFNDMLKRKEWMEPAPSTIDLEEISVTDKMVWLENTFLRKKKKVFFSHLFTRPSKKDYVVTFLAVLELMKENKVSIEQEENFGEIALLSMNVY